MRLRLIARWMFISGAAINLVGCCPRPSVAPPASRPASGLATAPAVRKLVDVPPGFLRVEVNGHVVLCEPQDSLWVMPALHRVPVKPVPAHTTAIESITRRRASLIDHMISDLALTDGRAVNQFLDEDLLPSLRKLEETRPPLVLLVVTSDRLKALVRTGWGAPRFQFNKVADAVALDDSIPMGHESDETVLPAFYDPQIRPGPRSDALAKGIEAMDTRISEKIAEQSTPMVFTSFRGFINDKHIAPLKLARDQAWLGMGISNYLAAKYIGIVTDTPKDQVLAAMITEAQTSPVFARSVDLGKPLESRKELVPYYTAAMQRKSTAVVAVWLTTVGEKAIPQTLTQLRSNMPADGPALVQLIKARTGFDVGKYLKPD